MLGQKPSGKIATIAGGFIYCLAAVGGGRSHCIDVERVCWFAVNLAFALHGLAHFFFNFIICICKVKGTISTTIGTIIDTTTDRTLLGRVDTR